MQELRLKGLAARQKARVHKLNQQAKATFSPSTFAQSAKLTRQANQLEMAMPKAGLMDRRLAYASKAGRAVQVCLSTVLMR
jgi:diaminopimelate decarboxylase